MLVEMREDMEGDAGIQMAPLIDCVFLLLIFFLVTAALREEVIELVVDLPEAGAATKNTALEDTIVVSVTKDGAIHLQGKPVSVMTLHKELRKAAQKAGLRVRVDGDRAAAFSQIAYVLDLCAFEGLKNVGIRTRDKQ
jgi:biopolymer transport protein ExbD